MWRWIGVLALGVLLGGLVFRGLVPPRPEPGYPRPIAVPGLTDAQRTDAMVSIHGHAHAARDPGLDVAPFLPLDEAVAILRRDFGPAADSRRRRAIAKLAAYGLDRRDFREAIEALGGRVEDLEEFLATVALRTPLEIYASIANYLEFMTPLCTWHALTSDVDSSSTHVEWRTELLVPRRVDEIARSLDPQSWPECLPTFQQAYFVETPAPCCTSSAGEGDCAPTYDSGSVFPKPAPSWPRGKPFSSRPLFEHVCSDEDTYDCWTCRKESCDVDFETLLCVESGYDIDVFFSLFAKNASRYKVGFNLVPSAQSGAIEFGEVNGSEGYPLAADYGHLCVEKTPSGTDACVPGVTSEDVTSLAGLTWSAVASQKRIEFESSAASAASGMLDAFEAELSGQLAELACCTVEEEPWSVYWVKWLIAKLMPIGAGGG